MASPITSCRSRQSSAACSQSAVAAPNAPSVTEMVPSELRTIERVSGKGREAPSATTNAAWA
jgi:hypothetical protein